MAEWYIAKNGQQEGPVNPQQIKALVNAGSLDPATALVWREGLTDWKPLGESELAVEIAIPTPAVASPAINNPYHVSERTRNSIAPEMGSAEMGSVVSDRNKVFF